MTYVVTSGSGVFSRMVRTEDRSLFFVFVGVVIIIIIIMIVAGGRCVAAAP